MLNKDGGDIARLQAPIVLRRGLDVFSGKCFYRCVLQIVFNEISAAEISRMDTLAQLELLDAFKVTESDLANPDGDRFGTITRDGKTLHRFRTDDCRIYFEIADDLVIVHRVLHKNSLSDFMFRSKLPLVEDEQLAESKHFWKLIDEGRNARRL